ncbi:MAG: hypothetical protein IJM51_07165 [Clostridia bacterium]|nr:hypothetical protein [Clostridia bacterium]
MIITDVDRYKDSGLYMGKMFSTLFGRTMEVVLHGGSGEFLGYAERCADYFNHMPEDLLAFLRACSLRYCEDMRECFDPAMPAVPESVTQSTVLDYARVNSIIIEKPKDSSVIAFSVEFSCDWEPEHGMEWTVRDGRALYVGDFMGISPWYADRVYETQCRSYVYEDFSL